MQWTSVVHAFGSQTSVESSSQPLQISFQDAVCTRTPEQNFIRVNKILEARRLVVEASWICCSGAGRDSSVGTAGLDAALRHLDGRLDQVQFSHGLNPGRVRDFPTGCSTCSLLARSCRSLSNEGTMKAPSQAFMRRSGFANPALRQALLSWQEAKVVAKHLRRLMGWQPQFRQESETTD